MSQEEKPSFIDKLKKPFKSHSRSSSKSDEIPGATTSAGAGSSDVVDAAYAAGQKAAHKEAGSSSTSASHDNTVEHAYIQGHRAGETSGYSSGHTNLQSGIATDSESGDVVASSSVGRVLSSPPRVKRVPVEKDLSGDFTNKKDPTDKSLVEKNAAAPDKLHDNDNPLYANEAEPQDGTGVFFNPKDTQGGQYGHNESGKHEEATRAELDSRRNLKTQPAAYAQEQKQQQEADKIKDTSYSQGVKAGQKDAAQEARVSQSKAQSQSDNQAQDRSLDPTTEHSTNKSAFNSSGVDTAKHEALGGAGTGAAGAAGIAAASHSGSHPDSQSKSQATSTTDSNLNPTVQSKSAGSNLDPSHNASATRSATTDPNDKSYLSTSVPPSDKNFDYDTELKRLDQQINQTQNEIENLQSSNVSTTGVYNQDLASKSLDPKASDAAGTSQHSGSASGGALAGAGGVFAAAASYVGLGGKTYEAGDHPVVQEAYEAGLKSGKANTSHSHTGVSGTTAPTTTNTSRSVDPNTQSQDSNSGGYLGGAFGAASALAAGTLGFGDNSSNKDKDLNKSELTSEDAYVKTSGKATGYDKVNPDGSAKPGVFDGATGALGAVAAAAGFGHSDDSTVNEAYDAGRQKAHAERNTASHSSVPVSKSTGPKAPVLDDVNDTTTQHSTTSSGGLSGALAGAAGALGFSYGSNKNDNGANATSKSAEVPSSTTGPSNKSEKLPSTIAPAHKSDRDPVKESQDPNLSSKKKASHPSTEPKSQSKSIETPTDATDSSNKGYLASATAAVTGAGGAAAGALGISGSKSEYEAPGESLIDTAARHHEDVAQAPPHKGGKDALANAEEGGTSGDGVQEVPGLTPSTEQDDSKVKSKKPENKFTEADVDAYNKKHGFNKKDGRSLIEVAEENYPEIKKIPAHKRGKQVIEEGEEEVKSKDGDVQEVPLESYDNQNTYIRTGGREGDFNDPTGPSGSTSTNDSTKTTSESNKATANSDPKDEFKSKKPESKFTEADVDAYNKKHGHTNKDGRSLIGVVEDTNPEVKEIPAHKRGKQVLDEDEEEGEKSKEGDVQEVPLESYGNQNAYIRTGGKEGDFNDPTSTSGATPRSGSKNVSGTTSESTRNPNEGTNRSVADEQPTSKDAASTTDPKGNSQLGYGAAAIGAGAAAVGGALSYFSGGKKTDDETPVKESYGKGVESGAYEKGTETAAHNKGVEAAQPRHRTAPQSESSVNEAYQQGLNTGAYESGNVKAAKDVSATQSGKDLSEAELKEYYEAGIHKGSYEAGIQHANTHQANQNKSASHGAGIATGGVAGGAAGAAAGSSKPRSTGSSGSGNNELVVEVIGVSDRDEASRIARSASKDLSDQGVDLSSGKLVINANTKEVYKTDDAGAPVLSGKATGNTAAAASAGAGTVGAAGAAGVVAANSHQHDAKPREGSFGSGRNVHEEDIPIPKRTDLTSADPAQPEKFHSEHEKAKERLSRAADQGQLGNISSETPAHESHDHSQRDDVLVNVHGTKSNPEATKIATGAIQQLKQTNPEVLANAKQINIDSKTGQVTDERGTLLASTNSGDRSSKLAGTSASSGTGDVVGSGPLVRGGLSDSAYNSDVLKNKTLVTDPGNTSGQNYGLTRGNSSEKDIPRTGVPTGIAGEGRREGLSSETYNSNVLPSKGGIETDAFSGTANQNPTGLAEDSTQTKKSNVQIPGSFFV